MTASEATTRATAVVDDVQSEYGTILSLEYDALIAAFAAELLATANGRQCPWIADQATTLCPVHGGPLDECPLPSGGK